MSLGLATSGYLSDEYLSDLPVAPTGGKANPDPPPKPPCGGKGTVI